MKLLSPLLLLLIGISSANAQVTSINENFDASCTVAGPNYPTSWSDWNVIPPTTSLGWNCGPLDGRGGSGGMECTSFYGGVNYFDSAWLFTPQLELSSYPGNIYLRFDAKYEYIAARMSVKISNNYYRGIDPDSNAVDWADVTSSLSPQINPNADSADWVTHYIDLTPFKTASTPIVVAFRYVSSSTAGGTWTIDNVFTTTFPQGITDITKQNLPVTVLGASTASQIVFSCDVPEQGDYKVSVYDCVGREVHTETVAARTGTYTYTLSNLDLHSGLYLVKMGNASCYGVAKAIVTN